MSPFFCTPAIGGNEDDLNKKKTPTHRQCKNAQSRANGRREKRKKPTPKCQKSVQINQIPITSSKCSSMGSQRTISASPVPAGRKTPTPVSRRPGAAQAAAPTDPHHSPEHPPDTVTALQKRRRMGRRGTGSQEEAADAGEGTKRNEERVAGAAYLRQIAIRKGRRTVVGRCLFTPAPHPGSARKTVRTPHNQRR